MGTRNNIGLDRRLQTGVGDPKVAATSGTTIWPPRILREGRVDEAIFGLTVGHHREDGQRVGSSAGGLGWQRHVLEGKEIEREEAEEPWGRAKTEERREE